MLTLKTKITNLQGTGRTLAWVGRRSTWIDGFETIIVEGAYPTACTKKGMAELMQAEVQAGKIKVALVTNMTVIALDDLP